MGRLRFLVWVPWWILQSLIAVEAQEGEGDWNGALATEGTDRDEEVQVYSPKKELGPGKQRVKFRPRKSQVQTEKVESVIVPGD